MKVAAQGRLYPKDRRLARGAALLLTLALAALGACLPKSPTGSRPGGQRNITIYAFSVMKEAMDNGVLPGFAAKWKQEHGEDLKFTASYAGSETITNQILQGVSAQVGIFSIERDADRLAQKGLVTSNWKARPAGGIVNKTPFVILVRKGNPKGIHDFGDLGHPGVKLIHPDPDGSGGALWSILAIYGSELVRAKEQQQRAGEPEGSAAQPEAGQARALQLLKLVWRNVLSTPDSARAARTQFETGYGDALITYELEGLQMKQAHSEIEIVVPRATIFSEHPAVVIDRNVSADDRALIEAFMQYLWGDEAQQTFVKYNFRSVTHEEFNGANPALAHIELPFTVGLFGGWEHAYPEVINGVWRNQVKKK
ncbi:MAG TPA: substrate-binding domain-containing protein [Pyrinomonadaceae bacterium]|nr:substrate-binding domain-containing protein [Pyrinomonadaceae bacterium]